MEIDTDFGKNLKFHSDLYHSSATAHSRFETTRLFINYYIKNWSGHRNESDNYLVKHVYIILLWKIQLIMF